MRSGVFINVHECVWGCVYDFINDNLSFFFSQIASEAGVLVKVGSYDDQGESRVDNGEVFEECSSKSHTHLFCLINTFSMQICLWIQ